MIYYISKQQNNFARVLFSRSFASAKFRENKTFAKIFKFTVINSDKHPRTTEDLSVGLTFSLRLD